MDILYLRRVKVVERLLDPKKFAREAYIISSLGYIEYTPLGFCDSSSPIPTQDQLEAEEFCNKEKEELPQVIPYIYYLPYSLRPELCYCINEEVKHLLFCDPFTQEVLISYIIDYVFRRANFYPTYRLLETVFFCSGRVKMIKEKVEPIKLDLGELMKQMFLTLDFLWNNLKFVTSLSINDITYKDGYYKISSFSSASVILRDKSKELYLLSAERNQPAQIFLSSFPYYYYSSTKRLPGSWSFYSLLFSIITDPKLREIFFTTPLTVEIWDKLFSEEDKELILNRLDKSIEEITSGIKLKCDLDVLRKRFRF